MFETSGNGGRAKWAMPRQMKAAGMYRASGVYLGACRDTGKSIFYDDEGHILTVSPPGGGKSVAVAIPSILHNRGSMVITDPKGALTAQTARFRRDMLGQKVIILNPWQDEISEGLKRDLGSTCFNPLASLKADDPALIDNAETLATILCPTPPDAKDTSWTDKAASILTGCLLYLVHDPNEEVTLPRLYQLVRQTREGWAALADRMMDVESLDLESYAAEILSPLASERQWAGYEQALHNATKIYNPLKPLGRHVSGNGFDPSILKRQDVTVYVVIPSNRREANKSWLALVMGLCAEAVGRAGVAKPVTLLCEEFANLGYMPTISRAMAEYREAGLRVHLVVQTTHQLTRIYGREGGQEIINLCAVRQYFGVDDLEIAQGIERSIGTFTATTESHNVSGDLFNAGSVNRGEMSVPLMRAQDILNMPKEFQIILMRGSVPPIYALVKPYYTDQAMLDATDPNPYRDEPQKRVAVPFKASPINMRDLPWWSWPIIAMAACAVLLVGFYLAIGAFAILVALIAASHKEPTA